eukprot:3290386-Pleurochrysis_carterae.AAC.1
MSAIPVAASSSSVTKRDCGRSSSQMSDEKMIVATCAWKAAAEESGSKEERQAELRKDWELESGGRSE